MSNTNHYAAFLEFIVDELDENFNANERADDIDELSYPPMYGEGVGFAFDGAEYAVLTDSEADDAWDESLNSYLDECILPELEGNLAQYFDRDAWKRDAQTDGRGHSLSSYDGEEHEVHLNGEWMYIYRTN